MVVAPCWYLPYDRAMSETTEPLLVEIDARGRVSLGKLGVSGLFLAHVAEDGAVVLEPATVVSDLELRLHADPALHQQIRDAAADLSNARPRRVRSNS